MRSTVAGWLTVLAILGFATVSVAQTTGPKSPPDVVVVGRRDHQEAAHRFVNEITVETQDQVAQFGEPVCPLAIGLPAAYNAAIERRVREDGRAAGVRVAAARCEPNVIIMISDDGRQLLDRLHRDRGPLFEGLPLHDLHALLDEPGPVHAWQGVELLDSGGFPVGIRDPNGTHLSLMADAPVAKGYMPSRLQQAFSRRIDTAFVVIDADAIDGLTPVQIADYAAMRTLAITRDPKGASMAQDSILTLFDPTQASVKPVSLSRSDAAYLHALYATSSVVSGATQRSNMAQSINRTLSSSPASDK